MFEGESQSELRAPHKYDVIIGARLRLARKQAGFSQEGLATRLRLSFQQTQKYEGGRNRISGSKLIEIARTLKIRVADLIGDLDLDSEAGEQETTRSLEILATVEQADLLRRSARLTSRDLGLVNDLIRSMLKESDET